MIGYKVNWSYIAIPLVTLVVARAGSVVTMDSVNTWYTTLNQPVLSPPNWVFGPVWALLYILATIAAIIVWNKIKAGRLRTSLLTLFAVNAAANGYWSVTFFANNDFSHAIALEVVMILTLLGLIGGAWKEKRVVSWLLLPYLLWVCFATYLTWQIWVLNP